MSRNWFKNIKKIIYYRGEDYYFSGRVKNIKHHDNIYSAEVIGTKNYETSVEIVNDELISSSCSCPYEEGICKHVAALLLAIEDENKDVSEQNEFEYNEIENGDFQKTYNYVQNSIEKLDAEALLAFIKEFVDFYDLVTLYEMEKFIRCSLNEKPCLDEKIFSSYLAYLKTLDEGKIYIEFSTDDYDEPYISDDHGITKQLTLIANYIKKIHDFKFYDASKLLIYNLLTLVVSGEYDYGDIVNLSVLDIVDDFDMDLYLQMYINAAKLTNDIDIDEIINILNKISFSIKDYDLILSLPCIKEILNKIVSSGEYERILVHKFNHFVDIFKKDPAFFKKLLIKTINDNRYYNLFDCVNIFLKNIEKDKLIETVEYFKDIIDRSDRKKLIYKKIYELYKKYGFDYEYYLINCYLLDPEFYLLLDIFKEPKMLKRHKEDILKTTLDYDNDIADFLLGRVNFYDSLKTIKTKSGINKVEFYIYLLLIIFTKIDVTKISSYKYIKDVIHRITRNNEDSYLNDYSAISESYNFFHKDENVNLRLIFNSIAELTEECVDSCFNSFSKGGREFWPISLHVIDYLATVLNVSLPSLWLKYSDKYRRYKEFKKGSKYWY